MRALLTFAVFAGLCDAAQAQSRSEAETYAKSDGVPQRTGRETGHRFLDELRTSPKPAEQGDLNTLTLASAHRERAASMEEKTSGLWQSWLVSICQGCGADRMPVAERDGSAYAKKIREQQAQETTGTPTTGRSMTGRSMTGKPRYTYFYPTRALRSGRFQLMVDNLSNENIDQIRRDPNR